MTKYVREYRIYPGSVQTIEMSKGAAIFHVDWRDRLLLVFAPFDSEAPAEERRIYTIANFEPFEPTEAVKHVGTVKTESGYLHVLANLPTPAPNMPFPVPLHMLPPELQEIIKNAQAEAEEDQETVETIEAHEESGKEVRQEEN